MRPHVERLDEEELIESMCSSQWMSPSLCAARSACSQLYSPTHLHHLLCMVTPGLPAQRLPRRTLASHTTTRRQSGVIAACAVMPLRECVRIILLVKVQVHARKSTADVPQGGRDIAFGTARGVVIVAARTGRGVLAAAEVVWRVLCRKEHLASRHLHAITSRSIGVIARIKLLRNASKQQERDGAKFASSTL